MVVANGFFRERVIVACRYRYCLGEPAIFVLDLQQTASMLTDASFVYGHRAFMNVAHARSHCWWGSHVEFQSQYVIYTQPASVLNRGSG